MSISLNVVSRAASAAPRPAARRSAGARAHRHDFFLATARGTSRLGRLAPLARRRMRAAAASCGAQLGRRWRRGAGALGAGGRRRGRRGRVGRGRSRAATASLGSSRSAAGRGAAAGRGLSADACGGRCRAAGACAARRPTRRGGLRRCGGRGSAAARRLLQVADHLADRGRLASLLEHFARSCRRRGGKFDRRLVGFDLDQRLVLARPICPSSLSHSPICTSVIDSPTVGHFQFNRP